MRILFVYDALYPDRTGGVEHRNRELARELAARGHDVTLAGWARELPEPPDGVEMLELPHSTELYDGEGRRRPWAALQFARAVAELDVEPWDVIETANIPYVHLIPLWLKTRASRTSLVVTWHEYMGPAWRDYLPGWKAPVFRAVERLVSSIGDLRIAVSEFTRDRLQTWGNACGRAVPVVPNGVPLEKLTAIRRDYGTPFGTGPALVFAGRLHANKRLHLVLEALAEIELDRAPPWFRIIGDGPRRKHLEERVRELGLGNVVEFEGRLGNVEEVWKFVAECDFAVQPSRREGFGMFPLEAMGLGLPVIFWEAQDSATGEIVEDGFSGIQMNDVEELQHVLDESGERYRRLRLHALERSEQFDWLALSEMFAQHL